MSDLSLVNNCSVRLILKAKQLQKLLAFDLAARALADSLCECALYLNLNVGNALDADDESAAAKSLDRALQKTGSARHYLRLLQKTKYLSPNAVNSFMSDLNVIEEELRPMIAQLDFDEALSDEELQLLSDMLRGEDDE